jgi:hypothetical protein
MSLNTQQAQVSLSSSSTGPKNPGYFDSLYQNGYPAQCPLQFFETAAEPRVLPAPSTWDSVWWPPAPTATLPPPLEHTQGGAYLSIPHELPGEAWPLRGTSSGAGQEPALSTQGSCGPASEPPVAETGTAAVANSSGAKLGTATWPARRLSTTWTGSARPVAGSEHEKVLMDLGLLESELRDTVKQQLDLLRGASEAWDATR